MLNARQRVVIVFGYGVWVSIIWVGARLLHPRESPSVNQGPVRTTSLDMRARTGGDMAVMPPITTRAAAPITTRAAAPMDPVELTTFELQVSASFSLEPFTPGTRVDVQLIVDGVAAPLELVEGARVLEVHRGYTAGGLGPGTDLPPHITLQVSNEHALALSANALKGRLVALPCTHREGLRLEKGQGVRSPPIDGPDASRER